MTDLACHRAKLTQSASLHPIASELSTIRAQGRVDRHQVRDRALRRRDVVPVEGIKAGASYFIVLLGSLAVLLALAYFALTRLGNEANHDVDVDSATPTEAS